MFWKYNAEFPDKTGYRAVGKEENQGYFLEF